MNDQDTEMTYREVAALADDEDLRRALEYLDELVKYRHNMGAIEEDNVLRQTRTHLAYYIRRRYTDGDGGPLKVAHK